MSDYNTMVTTASANAPGRDTMEVDLPDNLIDIFTQGLLCDVVVYAEGYDRLSHLAWETERRTAICYHPSVGCQLSVCC